MRPVLKWLLWMAALFILIGLLLSVMARGHCAYVGYTLQRDTHYAPFIGCLLVNKDGTRIPVSSLREVE